MDKTQQSVAINCLEQITMVPTHELVPHPRNPNKHPEEQLRLLAKIILATGWRHPIVVSKRSGFVISGHARLIVAERLGLNEVPVNYQDWPSEAREWADLIADNRITELAEMDRPMLKDLLQEIDTGEIDLELTGFTEAVIEDLVNELYQPSDGLTDDDAVPEEVEPICKTGDLWQLGNHRLLCGDATVLTDVERLMGGEKAELCFTSPPYADARDYGGNLDLSPEHLATFIRSSMEYCNYYAVNLGIIRKDGEVFQYWDSYIKEARDCGLKLLSWNVWDKLNAGSVASISSMFRIEHEWVIVFGDKSIKTKHIVPNKHAGEIRKHTIRQKNGKMKRSSTSVLRSFKGLGTITRLPSVNVSSPHPAMYPIGLPVEYIRSFNGDIYDPFGGSGSTLIACEKLGRRCFMMEIDEHYCDVIINRWENYTGKEALLIQGNGGK